MAPCLSVAVRVGPQSLPGAVLIPVRFDLYPRPDARAAVWLSFGITLLALIYFGVLYPFRSERKGVKLSSEIMMPKAQRIHS